MNVVLDLDGVIIDMVGGMEKHFDIKIKEWPVGERLLEKVFDMSPKRLWANLGFEFWANLKWNVDGQRILTKLIMAFGEENIVICTSPTLHPQAAAGKMAWIQNQLPDFSRRFLIGPAKEFLAHREAVLVDDFDYNVDKFREHGGHAILVPRPWNSNHELDTLPHIEECLKGL